MTATNATPSATTSTSMEDLALDPGVRIDDGTSGHDGRAPVELVVHSPSWATPSELHLRYVAGRREFVERIDFPVAVVPTASVHRLADLLAVVAGVSYHKAVGTRTIRPEFALTAGGVAMANAIYDHGMREFAFTNGLPIPTGVTVEAQLDVAHTASATPTGPASIDPDLHRPESTGPVSTGRESTGPVSTGPGSMLVPFGAGRDSTLLAARLAPNRPVLFRVGRDPHSAAAADELGLELRVVERSISPALLALNAAGAPNGHIPITAINSLIAALYADAVGIDNVVMANERASSAPTLVVDGHEINHQFSKSWACEVLLRDAIAETGSTVDYFSALRSWSEHDIAAEFATLPAGLQRRFMSCNKAFLRDPQRRTPGWCGRCAKCASTYLSLAPYLSPGALTDIFGSDLLADPTLTDEFAALITESDKPFECVSDVAEARRALLALTGDPAWASHVTVTTLGAVAQAARDGDEVERPHQPSAVPDFVEALLRREPVQ